MQSETHTGRIMKKVLIAWPDMSMHLRCCSALGITKHLTLNKKTSCQVDEETYERILKAQELGYLKLVEHP